MASPITVHTIFHTNWPPMGIPPHHTVSPGTYEGYKVYFFNTYIANLSASQRGEKEMDTQMNNYANPMDVRSPMVSSGG